MKSFKLTFVLLYLTIVPTSVLADDPPTLEQIRASVEDFENNFLLEQPNPNDPTAPLPGYLDEAEALFIDRLEEVDPNFVGPPENPPQPGLEEWAEDTSLGPFHKGGGFADFFTEQSSDWMRDTQTFSCNASDIAGLTTHLHTYDGLNSIPKVRWRRGIHPAGSLCDLSIYSDYKPLGLGFASGECLSIIPIYIGVDIVFFCVWADLIDYYYPTAIINFSNQLFYSRYLPFGLATASLAVLKSSLFANAVTKTWNVMNLALDGLAGSAPDIGTPEAWTPPPVDPSDPSSIAIEEAWIKSHDSGRMLIFGEEDIQGDHKPWQPHDNLAEPFFATDMTPNEIHYWLDQSATVGNGGEFGLFMGNPGVPCIKQNQSTGKTPAYPQLIDRTWTPSMAINGSLTGDLDDMPCLKNVGEVSPYTRHRRPHTSDAFFQTIVKGLKQYFAQFPASTYSFLLDKDRISFFPEAIYGDNLQMNDEFAEAVGGNSGNACPLFNRNVAGGEMKNTDFLEANQRVPGSKEEISAGVYTSFSGCWSILPQDAYMITWRYLPSMYESTLLAAERRYR